MSITHYKFNRPAVHLVANAGADAPDLQLSGGFGNATAESAYHSCISVLNPVGQFTARLISGSLPPGASISVDNVDKKVCVDWPEYSENDAPIKNPGFEDLFEGWEPGPGWRPSGTNPIAGVVSAGYIDQGGESVISSLSRYLAAPNTPIHAKCLVRQGASAAGNAGAAVRLEYRDPTTGNVIGFKDGNAVMSASDNVVYPSDVNAVTPGQSVMVNVAGKGIRNRENKEVWIDSFEWDHTVPVAGTNTSGSWTFTIRVTDSAGREVYGTFTIVVNGASSAKLWIGPINNTPPFVHQVNIPGGSKSDITPAALPYDQMASNGEDFVVFNSASSLTQKLSFDGGTTFVNSTTTVYAGAITEILKTAVYYMWAVGSSTGRGQIVRKRISDGVESTIYSWNSSGLVRIGSNIYISYTVSGNTKYGVSTDEGATFSEFDTSSDDCFGLIAIGSDLIRIVEDSTTFNYKMERYVAPGNWVSITIPTITSWDGWAAIGNRGLIIVNTGPNQGVYVYDRTVHGDALVASTGAPTPALSSCGPGTGGCAAATSDKFYILGYDQKLYTSATGSGDWAELTSFSSVPSPTNMILIA